MRHRSRAPLDEQRQLGHRQRGVAAAPHRRRAGVAGHAGDFADEAHAAVDRGDHAQRQVQLREHRPLFDVDLDKAEITRRIALQGRNVIDAQTGMLHRGAHRHAVGVHLIEPRRIELADQRARAEEGRLVPLALLLREADHLDAEGQPTPGAVQLGHHRHRHEDAQAPVVLAAVAYRVVVAAGEQARRAAVAAVVNADDVADRVDLDLVEAAVGLHPVREPLRAGAVRVGQVGHGQLAALGIAGVAVLRELLGPVPHAVAQLRRHAELVVQADLGDAVDVAQALVALEVHRVAQAAGEGGDDLVPPQPEAARPAHGQDEGEAEPGVVVGVELLQPGEFLGRAVGQAGLALLVGRLGGERLRHHRLAGQLRVGADQRELRLQPRVSHDGDESVFQPGQARERPQCGGAFGDPRRVLVGAVQQRHELGGRGGVEVFDRQGHGWGPAVIPTRRRCRR